MGKPLGEITRSHRFTLAFQLQGLCEGLRNSLQRGEQPGPITVLLTRKLMQDLFKVVDSPAVEGLPEIKDNASLCDLLVMAEVLNATLKSFLDKDEVKGIAEIAATWLGVAAKAKSVIG